MLQHQLLALQRQLVVQVSLSVFLWEVADNFHSPITYPKNEKALEFKAFFIEAV
jgi:hypothetical protein